MPKVFLTIPSARPGGGTIAKWRERGYGVAVFLNPDTLGVEADLTLRGEYPGYAQAVNTLCREVLERYPEVEWCVAGGDDTLPDPYYFANEIASYSTEYFGGTFGVMQPTGDRFAGGSIDRIAGSPWMGREWCMRANGGAGPMWPEFTHMFVDEAIMRTAEKLGVYLRRPDLIHFHRHFMRESDAIDSNAVHKPIPEHLREWNSPQHWEEMKAIFQRLEREDFAPCMPLSAGVAA